MKRKIVISFLFLFALVLVGCNRKPKLETFEFISNVEESEYFLKKYNGSEDSIIIPDEHLGKKVTKIEKEAFKNNSVIKKVTISNNIELIGEYAFDNSSVEEIVFNDGSKLAKIDNSAFYGASELTKVNIPNTVTTIEDYAFYGASSLNNVNLPSTVTKIGSFSFANTFNLKTVTIPNKVTEVGISAFYNAQSLTKVDIPQTVTNIGYEAFAGARNLKDINVNVNNSVYSSENGILYNKDKTVLIKYPEGKTSKTYEMPSTVLELEKSALFQADKLEKIIFSNNLLTVNEQSVSYLKVLKELVIPSTVTSIKEGAFKGLEKLNKLVLPIEVLENEGNEITHIGYLFGRNTYNLSYGANYYRLPQSLKEVVVTGSGELKANFFKDLSYLKEIEVHESVNSIEKGAFHGLANLESITLPYFGNSLNAIDEKAYFGYVFGELEFSNAYAVYHPTQNKDFYLPSSLTKVVITGGEKIKEKEFMNANSLVEVILPQTLLEIGKGAFNGANGILALEIPGNVQIINSNSFMKTGRLREIIVDENNNNYLSNDGVLYNKDQTVIIKYPEAKRDKIFEMPNTVLEIAEFAFYDNLNLEEIEFSKNLLTISKDSFVNAASLLNLVIPSSVTSIKEGAFNGTKKLSSIDFHFSSLKDNGETKEELAFVFGYDESSKKYYVPETLKKIVVQGNETVTTKLFTDLTTITDLILKDSIKGVKDSALKDNRRLVNLEVPLSKLNDEGTEQESIGYMFGWDERNNRFSVPNTMRKLTVVGNKVVNETLLSGFTHITEVILSDQVESIEPGTLKGFVRLIGLELSLNSLNVNGEEKDNIGYIFGWDDENERYFVPATFKTLVIKGDGKLESNHFVSFENITNLTIKEGISSIAKGTLSNLSTLVNLEIPYVGSKLDAQNEEAFFGYIFGEEEFDNSYAVYHPGGEVKQFYLPKSLREVVITGGTTIVANAFKDASTLTKVVIPETVVNMGADVFDKATRVRIYVVGLEKAPETWSEDWNKGKRPVVWDYKE